MKKLLITAIIAVSLISIGFAAPANESLKVSGKISKNTLPRSSTVKWEKMGNYTRASFLVNNVVTEVFYNADGEFVGTGCAIDLESLHEVVKSNLNNDFGNSQVKEIFQLNGTEIFYYVTSTNDKQLVL